jgi:cyclophilin family peptidyl-prolyl cis-trans isomerase
VPSDKRERQRQRAELARLAAERRARRQRITRVVVVFFMIAAIGGAGALAFLSADNSTDVASGTTTTIAGPGSTTTTAPIVEAPSCPPLEEVALKAEKFPTAPELTIDTNKTYLATISTDSGDINIQLDAAKAPLTVNNFVFLAREGFYDGVRFHRVIKNFVIQGGDPTATGSGGPGYSFADELPTESLGPNPNTSGNPEANPNLYYREGSLAMANSGPNTNGSQFFIITGQQGVELSPNYSLFGQVTDGQPVIDVIESDGSDPNGGPLSIRHCILSVTITEQ